MGIGTRNDNLYEVGGGLTWQFLPTWSLNPEILYIRDRATARGQLQLDRNLDHLAQGFLNAATSNQEPGHDRSDMT